MSTPLRALFLCAILTIAASAFGQVNIVNFDFGAVPVECGSNYAYQGLGSCSGGPYSPTQNFNQTPGFGWMLGSVVALGEPPFDFGGAGLTGPYSAFCPPSFDGMPFRQVVFLQSIGSFVAQAVGGFTAGNYTLSFYLGGRCAWGPQRIAAMIDGNVIGTWDAPPGMPFTLETATFTVSTDGTHVLKFVGINPWGDHTAFLSYVTITRAGDW